MNHILIWIESCMTMLTQILYYMWFYTSTAKWQWSKMVLSQNIFIHLCITSSASCTWYSGSAHIFLLYRFYIFLDKKHHFLHNAMIRYFKNSCDEMTSDLWFSSCMPPLCYNLSNQAVSQSPLRVNSNFCQHCWGLESTNSLPYTGALTPRSIIIVYYCDNIDNKKIQWNICSVQCSHMYSPIL